MGERFPYSTESDELLTDRARELREPPDQNTSPLRTYICFPAGGNAYAIESGSVVEVLGAVPAPLPAEIGRRAAEERGTQLPIFSIPGAPPFLLGIINLRGSLHTVLDLSRLLFDTPTAQTGQSQLLQVDDSDAELCLLTEGRSETLIIHEDQIHSSTETMPPELQTILSGAVPFHDSFIGIIDCGRLAAHPQLTALINPPNVA